MEQKQPVTGLIGFQCIVGQWRLDLQTFRPAATVPIRINSISRGSTVLSEPLQSVICYILACLIYICSLVEPVLLTV